MRIVGQKSIGRTIGRWAFASLLIAPAAFGTHNVVAATAPGPDFSGIWARESIDFEKPSSGPGPVRNLTLLPNGTRDIVHMEGDDKNPILKPVAVEAVRRQSEFVRRNEAYHLPSSRCWPEIVPYILNAMTVQFLQQGDMVTLLYVMENNQFRQVRLNSRHPANLKPSWYGDSIGHYEGDTLVIDTVGFKTSPLSMLDHYGTPYTSALHVVERYRFIDGATAKEVADRNEKENGNLPFRLVDRNYSGKGLQLQFTVEDEGVFTTPWSAEITYRRSYPGVFPGEAICAETTRNPALGQDIALPMTNKPDF